MTCKFSDLQRKEVICVADGRRLGYVCDAQIEIPEGHVLAIVVPGMSRCFGLLSRPDEYVIPWHCIRRIGPDVILVDIKPDACRVPKKRPVFWI